MAIIGSSLPTPEPGWSRYDNTNIGIYYLSGTWNNYNFGSLYNGSFKYADGISKINFKFYGTKLRIFDLANCQNRSSNIKITIDGIIYTFSESYGTGLDIILCLVYEKLDLPLKVHDVTIENTTGRFGIDAIDIDSGGILINATTPKHIIRKDGIYYYKNSNNETCVINTILTQDDAINKGDYTPNSLIGIVSLPYKIAKHK
jgi:hypothetical protein